MGPRRHRRARSIPRLTLTALLLAGCGTTPSEQTLAQWPDAPDDASRGTVTSVIDGDSLVVLVDGSEVEVRLGGVNAPESDECHAEEAREALREAVRTSVMIEVFDTDQYGRSVAHVWGDAGFINGRLVDEGHAIAMTPAGRSTDELIAAETLARQEGRGLWSPHACGETTTDGISIETTNPDPPGPDNERLDEEFVTIRNTGDTTVDITDWTLRDESSVNRLRFPPGTTVPPNGELIVASGCSPIIGIGWCSDGAVWNNNGDSALLLAPEGTVVAHARYAPSP